MTRQEYTAAQGRYARTPKGRATRARYDASFKGRMTRMDRDIRNQERVLTALKEGRYPPWHA